MKYNIALLLPVAAALVAAAAVDQTHFDDSLVGYPGYDIDLQELRLVQFEGEAPQWMSELEKIKAKAAGRNFFDITDTPDLGFSAQLRAARKPSFPKPNATEIVQPILGNLSVANLKETLTHFSSFRTRYYRSDTGKESEQWLLSKISEYTAAYAPPELQSLISIKEFPHSWQQSTIIVRINGSSTSDDAAIIISAHQDSTNMWPFLPAPGAGDDGSGSMSILESYRGLLAANYRPGRPIEFHWYAAEEGGLLGSQAVAQDYEARSVNVLANLHFDMTAWVKRGTREVIGVLTDFVNLELTELVKQLVETYLDIPAVTTKCGYACSDHGSWTKAGYPSSSATEGRFEDTNPHLHSVNDRIDISDEFSFPHMLQFSKLAASFAIELSEAK